MRKAEGSGMKKMWRIVLPLLGAALIAAGAWYFIASNRQLAQIEAAHDTVLTEYTSLLRSAEGAAITVLEGGNTIGTFTLHELGLLQGTQTAMEQIQKKTLMQQIAAWGEMYDEKNTDYLFDSFVDGPVPIDFLKVDYTLDQTALADTLISHLHNLESAGMDAPFLCTTPDGDPFSLGDSYIEVDITDQHMTYYQDGRLVVSTDVVTGMPGGHATPRGLYHTYYKCEDIWLTGEDYFVFVDYWISVTPDASIGLHDADWRTRFGGEVYLYGGSHGCVNTPKEAMKTIYDTVRVEDNIPILIYTHQKAA